MTPHEYRKAIIELLRNVGLKAEAYTSFNNDGPIYSVALYPYGIVGSTKANDGYLRVDGNSFAELFQNLSAGWKGYEARHRAEIIRKMALAIIRITAERGECTDAALRNEFDASQLATYGEDACRDANDIAGNGPFKIKRKRGANEAA